MTLYRIVTLAAAIGVAISLAGCASSPPPLSLEETLYFEKAVGSGIIGPPGLRYQPPPGYVYPGALVPPPPGYR